MIGLAIESTDCTNRKPRAIIGAVSVQWLVVNALIVTAGASTESARGALLRLDGYCGRRDESITRKLQFSCMVLEVRYYLSVETPITSIVLLKYPELMIDHAGQTPDAGAAEENFGTHVTQPVSSVNASRVCSFRMVNRLVSRRLPFDDEFDFRIFSIYKTARLPEVQDSR
ncbi:hypothetical protein VTN77DRAFT_867 [Rasamsonia byssochlamydoides]|uniref:uncharacterized protein n=1 Tax=Rasamsonia byssochlamydoides TaxID=89139 RepID=UPI00374337A7